MNKFLLIFLLLPHFASVVVQGQYYDDIGQYDSYADYLQMFTEPPRLVSDSSKFARICQNDFDCGPNEVCQRNSSRFWPRTIGHCDCRRCFAYDLSQQECVPMTSRTKVCNRTIAFMLVQYPTTPASNATLNSTLTTAIVTDEATDDTLLTTTSEYKSRVPTTTLPWQHYFRTTTTRLDTCDNTCDPLSKTEIYPENSQCLSNGRLVCSKCYYASPTNTQCLPLSTKNTNKLNQGEKCQSDCDCKATLKCRPTCSCPQGKRWDSDKSTCVDIVVGYGDTCDTDSNCTFNSGSENRFASFSGAKCVSVPAQPLYDNESNANQTSHNANVSNSTTSVCSCASGYTVMLSASVNPSSGRLSTKRICVRDQSRSVRKGGICHLDPIEVSDNGTSVICEPRSTCHKCPEGELATKMGLGRCRSVTPFTDLHRWHNAKVLWPKWDGYLCSQDSDCERKSEVCLKQPVDPPCQLGICVCPPNFGHGWNGECVPIRRLPLSDRCNGTENEQYPPNADCAKDFSVSGGIVVCDTQYKKVGRGCIRDTFSYVDYGSVCNDNCATGLICGAKGVETCECPYTNQAYVNQTCQARRLGSLCKTDAECDASHPPRKRQPAGRVCLTRSTGAKRCSCDPKFTAAECFAPRSTDPFNEWDSYSDIVDDGDDFSYPDNKARREFCRIELPKMFPKNSSSFGGGSSGSYYGDGNGNSFYNYDWTVQQDAQIISSASICHTSTILLLIALLIY